MIPRGIAILLTYRCNFRCRHCAIEASKLRKESLDREYIRKAIDEISEFPTVKVVSFTGGEPTLEMSNLKWAISYASKKGLITRLVTNGWWATDFNRALDILSELKQMGLKEFNMSFGDFHLPYLGDEMKIVYAIKAAKELGLRCAIATVKAKGSKIDVPYIIKLLKKGSIDISDIFFVTDYVTPVGRGRSIPEKSLVYDRRPLDIGCFEILRYISVHPNGEVRLCCGQSMLEVPELLGGNIKRDRISDIIREAQQNILYWWLFIRGPKGILEYLNCRANRKFVNICDECRYLFTKCRKQLYRKIKEDKYEIILYQLLESDLLKRLKKAYDLVSEDMRTLKMWLTKSAASDNQSKDFSN